MNVVLQHIIQQLQTIQDGKVWVGANYTSKLSNIDEQNAFIRPLPDLHSVAEIISHLTIWQKETILKIQTGKGSLTDNAVENWYTNDYLKKKKWAKIYKEYQSSLSTLIELLNTKDDPFLMECYYDPDFKGNYPYSFIVNGMLHHSIYHLGQLGIIVKYLEINSFFTKDITE